MAKSKNSTGAGMSNEQINWIAGFIWGIADNALRDTLLPKLLNGEIEIHAAEALAEEVS